MVDLSKLSDKELQAELARRNALTAEGTLITTRKPDAPKRSSQTPNSDAVDFGKTTQSKPKSKKLNLNFNPGGSAGAALQFTPGGTRGMGVSAEAMSNESAARVASAANAAVQRALPPAPTESNGNGEQPVQPEEPEEPEDNTHGGIWYERTNKDGTHDIVYNDGFMERYDSPGGTLIGTHDYGSISGVPSDRKLKHLIDGVSGVI